MILFYSDFCKHCNVLIDTINKHDQNKIIKLVSIDTLRSLNKAIDPKIHSVPALYINDTQDYLFGKSVFDHLLLPNRGVLFNNNLNTNNKSANISGNNIENKEPSAFTLGSIYSQHFSSLDAPDEEINDKNFTWNTITDDNNNESNGNKSTIESVINQPTLNGSKKNLPSLEDLITQRNKELL